MTRLQADFMLNALKRALPLDEGEYTVFRGGDPFELIVTTVLSQNTNDRNSMRAFKLLRERVGIDPHSLARASLSDIEDAIRIGGLHHNKAKSIKLLAPRFLDFDWGSIAHLTYEEMRKFLMGLPGIGPKTADIFLLFYAKRDAFPVDTHIARVSKRLGLVGDEADYEGITEALKRFFRPDDYRLAHLELIALGRRFCRARDPLCQECPLAKICPSAFKLSRPPRTR